MAKNVTYRERARARHWNPRAVLEQERSRRWLRRHAREYRGESENRPWWWRFATR